MNVDEIIDTEQPESSELDYKHPEATSEDLVKELVAVANSGGGSVIIGVEEDDGTIVDIHDVSNPSQIEESIQQHIREKVDPDLSVSHTIERYTGKIEDYCDCTVLVLNAEPGRTLYSYKVSGSKILFPYRLGSTTDYLTGSQLHRFYRNGIWPGRPETTSNEEASGDTVDEEEINEGNPWTEVATAVASLASDSKEESDDERQGSAPSDEVLPSGFELQPSETPYHFTPAGGINTVTFHHVPYYPDAYGIEGFSIHVEKSNLRLIFGALKRYFDAQVAAGHFTITQRNAAWFGQGAGDFLAALDIEDRYVSVPESFTIDKHHSEGTIFVVDSQIGTIVVRSRRGINVSHHYLDQFSVSFCTDGVPVDTRSLEQFLNAFDYDLHPAHSFDMEGEQLHFGGRGIEVEPIKLLRSYQGDDYAAWAICRNPFYKRPDLLIDNLNSDNSELEILTEYERIPCRIKDHHPINERREYELLRASIRSLTPIQGTVPHTNAMVWINW